MKSLDSTQRFSSHVADYVRFRPRYPREVVEMLAREARLTRDWVVADVGAGTGISAELFLENGNVVWCVEPNREMRGAAESLLSKYAGFRSLEGSAEGTGLPSGSIDLIVCAQAFHWFDQRKAREEFVRILKAGGVVVLMWNERKETGSAFSEGYEALLDGLKSDYQRIKHQNVTDERIAEWFGGTMRKRTFANGQKLDWEGLRGRAMSSSYVPTAGQEGHEEFVAALRGLFDETQLEGFVKMEYETQVYFGTLNCL